MLANASLQTIICTTDLVVAEAFYRDTLGLPFKRYSEGAAVFEVNGCDLRISPVSTLLPSEHTVLGFAVDNVHNVVLGLVGRGVKIRRFDGFPHDVEGVLTTPGGSRVAWFQDPDSNLLSVVEYAY